jgi:amino-acid N-acetyltransferase
MTSDEPRERPSRVRVTGLQEAQLPDLVEAERGAAAMYYEAGFDAAEVPTRSVADIVALTREHEVLVAEADRVVAGYLAWRDEAPGVAYLADLTVGPELQRVGVGTALVEELCRRARAVTVPTAEGSRPIEHVVVRCWRRATWASRFYARRGFRELDEAAPADVRAWFEARAAVGRPVTRPGEVVLWAPTWRPEPTAEDDAEGDG